MFGIREHNRKRLAQRQAESGKTRDYGTQVEEKSTRTIGTMPEPVVTRNAGNEAQPQSSATQTSNLFRHQQQQGDEEDERDFQQTTSSPLRNDTRTNGYHPSKRITSADRRNKHAPSSAIDRQYEDHSNHDQYRPRHRSHYHDDPRDQYTTPQDGDGRYSFSRTRPRRQSPASPPSHTPPPPVEYRSSSPSHNHHRSPATRRSRSRSPSTKKHITTSTDRHSSRSPPSQHRSRPAQRSTSPPTSRHHVSSSPPPEYRSSHPAKNDSRRSKHQPQKVSVATDTSLDRMARSQHRAGQSESPSTREFGTATSPDLSNHQQQKRSPHSDYQKLDSNPPKQQDQRKKTSYDDNQPPSTQKSYRLRPKVDNSFTNDEETPSRHDESTSPPNNRSFDRSDDRRRPAVSPKTARRSAGEEQYPKTTTAKDETPNDDFHRQLPRDDSISIRSTSVIQPESLPGSRRQKKSPAQKPLHHGQQRQSPPRRDSSLLNFGTTHVDHQPSMNEVAMPFNIRYLPDPDDDHPTGSFNFRTSTLKGDALRDNTSRILLLPVLNSSRTYVFEKQSLSGDARQMRQSRTNGNFYLATSPILHSLNSSFHEGDPDDLTGGHALRTQVA